VRRQQDVVGQTAFGINPLLNEQNEFCREKWIKIWFGRFSALAQNKNGDASDELFVRSPASAIARPRQFVTYRSIFNQPTF